MVRRRVTRREVFELFSIEDDRWRDALGKKPLEHVLHAGPELDDDVRFVRLCVYLSDSSTSSDDRLFITYEWHSIHGPSRRPVVDKIRDEGTAATAEYIVANLDNTRVSMNAWKLWNVTDVGGFGEVASSISNLQSGLHKLLVGEPVENVLSAFGVPGSAEAGLFAEQIDLGSIDHVLRSAKLGVQIVGIAAGVISGNHLMACACFKDMVRDRVHELMVDGVTSGIKSIITGDRPVVVGDSPRSARPPGARTTPRPAVNRYPAGPTTRHAATGRDQARGRPGASADPPARRSPGRHAASGRDQARDRPGASADPPARYYPPIQSEPPSQPAPPVAKPPPLPEPPIQRKPGRRTDRGSR